MLFRSSHKQCSLKRIATIVSGIADGCKQAGAALIGGETAEMPGFYEVDEYDLAGFAVGIVDEKDIIDGSKVKENDIIIGISSSGIHSNGYSLVRSVFNMKKEALDIYYDSLGATLGETLLTPTKIYVNSLKAVKNENIRIKAASHITGGGFYENVPRMLPLGVHANIQKDSYETPAIFEMLSKDGQVAKEAMYNTFNMGIGMMLVVDPSDADKTLKAIKDAGEDAYIIGEIVAGEKGVTLC